jgi:hypothetical protein
MKRAFRVLVTVLVILPWFSGARVQAEMIQWSASGSGESAYGPTYGTAEVPALPAYGLSPAGIQMFPGGNASGTNSRSVVLTQLYASVGGAADGRFYDFSSPSSQYQLSLLLRDQASGASGTLTFRGYFNGVLPYDQDTSAGTFTNTFVGPTTKTLKLGHNLYTVTLGPIVLPQDYSHDFTGSISASISVQPATNSTPEPSSLLLACLGLPSLGLVGWFRRRRNALSGNAI